MTSAAGVKVISEAKKEKFADLIVILGLKYQEFNGKINFFVSFYLDHRKVIPQVVDTFPTNAS